MTGVIAAVLVSMLLVLGPAVGGAEWAVKPGTGAVCVLASRAAFRAALADLVGAPPPAPARSEPAPAQSPAPEREITPALLARPEHMLTRQIGPLARVFVREAVKRAATPRELFERLAVHIDNEEVRKAFIAEADRPAKSSWPGVRTVEGEPDDRPS